MVYQTATASEAWEGQGVFSLLESRIAQLAHSSLGKCISSWLRAEQEHLLIPLESYFDGSSDGTNWVGGNYMTLAGFAAPDSIWAEFDPGWIAVLAETDKHPKAAYLHMKEARALEKEFNFRNGWNHKKVSALVTQCLMYLQTFDKQRFRMFVCAVDLQAHRRLSESGLNLPDPIQICIENCPRAVLSWYFLHYPGIIETAHYFFDKNEPFEDRFRELWKKETNRIIDATSAKEVWSLIKTVTSADMRDKPGLQAADLLAWSTNRRLNGDEGDFGYYIEHIMKQIIPSYYVTMDEPTLIKKYAGMNS